MVRADFAGRASALVGTRFRPQGRNLQRGVDCLGLILVVFEIPDAGIRRNYRLRGDHRSEITVHLQRHFRRIPARDVRPGDLLLLSVATDQLHFAITTQRGFVHADAKIGKVVETPGATRWPLAGAYRKRAAARRSA